jgi:hypothetical protein
MTLTPSRRTPSSHVLTAAARRVPGGDLPLVRRTLEATAAGLVEDGADVRVVLEHRGRAGRDHRPFDGRGARRRLARARRHQNQIARREDRAQSPG